MLNRPTDVPVARLFSAASRKEETAYAGGPLALGINGLSKSKSRPRGAIAITGGLWLLPDKEAIEVALASGNPVRVYVGQCGWSTRQIETEIARGLWVVSPGDADLVFDPAPDTLWKRLSARSRH